MRCDKDIQGTCGKQNYGVIIPIFDWFLCTTNKRIKSSIKQYWLKDLEQY